MSERTNCGSAATHHNDGFVNAVVTVRIPLKDVATGDDPGKKLEAAVAAVDAGPLGEMGEVDEVTFEDVRAEQAVAA